VVANNFLHDSLAWHDTPRQLLAGVGSACHFHFARKCFVYGQGLRGILFSEVRDFCSQHEPSSDHPHAIISIRNLLGFVGLDGHEIYWIFLETSSRFRESLIRVREGAFMAISEGLRKIWHKRAS